MSQFDSNRLFNSLLYNEDTRMLLTKYNNLLKGTNELEKLRFSIMNSNEMSDKETRYKALQKELEAFLTKHKNFLVETQELEINYFEAKKQLSVHQKLRDYSDSIRNSYWNIVSSTPEAMIYGHFFLAMLSGSLAFTIGLLISAAFISGPLAGAPLAFGLVLGVAVAVALSVQVGMVYYFKQVQNEHEIKFHDESRKIVTLEREVTLLEKKLKDKVFDPSETNTLYKESILFFNSPKAQSESDDAELSVSMCHSGTPGSC